MSSATHFSPDEVVHALCLWLETARPGDHIKLLGARGEQKDCPLHDPTTAKHMDAACKVFASFYLCLDLEGRAALLPDALRRYGDKAKTDAPLGDFHAVDDEMIRAAMKTARTDETEESTRVGYTAALAMLPETDYVHIYTDGPNGTILGSPWVRDHLLKAMRAARYVGLAGPGMASMGHCLVLQGSGYGGKSQGRDVVFVETVASAKAVTA